MFSHTFSLHVSHSIQAASLPCCRRTETGEVKTGEELVQEEQGRSGRMGRDKAGTLSQQGGRAGERRGCCSAAAYTPAHLLSLLFHPSLCLHLSPLTSLFCFLCCATFCHLCSGARRAQAERQKTLNYTVGLGIERLRLAYHATAGHRSGSKSWHEMHCVELFGLLFKSVLRLYPQRTVSSALFLVIK